MNVRVAFVGAALSCLGMPFGTRCAGQGVPPDGNAVRSQRYLLLAERYIKIGSSKNEMTQYQSAGNVLGGANYALARRCFRTADQELKREAGGQPLDQQPRPMRQRAARILGEQGWFLYQTSAGADRQGAARLVSRAAALDPKSATLQFKMAAVLVDRYADGGQKDQRLLRDVKARLDRASALGPEEAAPAFFMSGALAAAQGGRLPQVGTDYMQFLAHAQGLNPEIYLYDMTKIEGRCHLAFNDVKRYTPSLMRRLKPQVLPNISAKVKAAIVKIGRASSGQEPEPVA